MAISRFARVILKALSKPNFDLRKTYLLERALKNLKKPFLSPIYKSWNHRIYVGNREILTRVFTPSKGQGSNTILFFHGGGWVTENIESYNTICKHMARRVNSIVISVEYRLAPEHPFPQGLEDCYAVTKLVCEKQEKERFLPGKIVLMGDSAGGNLAAAVSLRGRDRGEFHVEAQVLIYPATYWDHSVTSPFRSVRENGTDYLLTAKRIRDYMSLYKRNDRDLMNPYFAPLMAGDFTKQPPTLLISAQFDPLRDEGEEYGKRLKEAGNEVTIYRMEDALHGYIVLGQHHSHVKKTYDLINEFLDERDA